jgi:hypothetical protein
MIGGAARAASVLRKPLSGRDPPHGRTDIDPHAADFGTPGAWLRSPLVVKVLDTKHADNVVLAEISTEVSIKMVTTKPQQKSAENPTAP